MTLLSGLQVPRPQVFSHPRGRSVSCHQPPEGSFCSPGPARAPNGLSLGSCSSLACKGIAQCDGYLLLVTWWLHVGAGV